ncbi:MAG: beta-N-acetylhexosaminidase [Candidatus Dactylopiibacterium carminicum]|uniref:Beta-hexosaminidase n=1 Tax=Candidatus Dactylopiibacterium carminicum TaxID=857335 RepID=A0A272EVY6_9RHOO|nr:beta-N-acetylhexosaminidase [Candidatus Dactylopiibacterium carminicum]KAF7599531.1 beta-N-acetylhexosaminidase [Candidatus Dactylopiibacterium carminicum]PAS94274.1 MAG: beta-N-acetylhexosaminidase [Candidatus Dactylopiibacterium carminicum]PAS98470.1 MAG: beta-N-acetylhexosaminidase [Candidatus Dactylopiibacterium carminicum]PAS99537.1 MAG: beta-N-acetylhexosaminidase [Candidatus Dactylopiibacterium carminicum]
MTISLPLGPVLCDVAGHVLTEAERETLRHPLVGGVILFSRNFDSPEQLQRLCAEIHALREPALLVTVDHEGGRVQRFCQGFTRLPPMRALGDLYARSPRDALLSAQDVGYVLGTELLAHGVDLSFTPVLDLDHGHSGVIGDRAFHREPQIVAMLAHSVAIGLREAGMGCVGKHFPGHGFAEADSHVAMPVDGRDFDAIWQADIAPYRGELRGTLSGVMPAHVVFTACDSVPACFSSFWLQDVLRGRVGFDGLIFSDDLTMQGAAVMGDIVARADAAHRAGCDVVLVCNHPELTAELLSRWQPEHRPATAARLAALRPQTYPAMEVLSVDKRFTDAWVSVQNLGA